MVIKHYKLQADHRNALALRTALDDLSAQVAVVPGAIKIDLYQDALEPHRFLMVEHWASAEAHKASTAYLDKDAFKPVMPCLAIRR
jgi:quinol monooxygenase YgiN